MAIGIKDEKTKPKDYAVIDIFNGKKRFREKKLLGQLAIQKTVFQKML